MTPPVPVEVREQHEAVDDALSDIGHVATLLHLVFEQMGDRPCEAEALGLFLARLLQDRHRDAELHMEKLWVASGGNPEGTRQP
ncbi:MAG TPA: hypothetical protein VNZ61_02425 [Roseomonas sp.]|nr:hypothetical protein [Roseomonas sp.]